jgi:polyisoprenoid-binding protein YceI
MTIIRYLQLALCTTLLTVACSAVASEPCAPFEGGRVDAKILKAMRDAAQEGRMYRVVPGVSRVGFCIRHFPFQEFRGEFTNIVGGLALPSNTSDHGHALLLIHTTSMVSSNMDLAPMVQSPLFMDTERYPEILFVGHAFQWVDPQHAHIAGDITLHGRTQPVIFEVYIDAPDEHDHPGSIQLSGTSQVNRMKFDMRSHRFLVSETVRLCMSVELVPWDH